MGFNDKNNFNPNELLWDNEKNALRQYSPFWDKWTLKEPSKWDMGDKDYNPASKYRSYQDVVLKSNRQAEHYYSAQTETNQPKAGYPGKSYPVAPQDNTTVVFNSRIPKVIIPNKTSVNNNSLPKFAEAAPKESAVNGNIKKEPDTRRSDSVFNDEVNHTLKAEGGYSNRKNDRGGETNMGITIGAFRGSAQRLLGKEPTSENLKSLSSEEAKKIYYTDYWRPLKPERFNDDRIVKALYDFSVNSSHKNAIKTLQQTLNGLGANVQEDGVLGPSTMDAINNYPDKEKLLDLYLSKRREFVEELADSVKTQKSNLNGWNNRIDNIRDRLKK